MRFRVLPEMSDHTAKSIFITGGTRSGTTLMARLIYSLDQVECFHEPPFLYAFFYLMDEIGEEQWKTLFESFVFQELLLSALAGRRLNFNEHDDSSVYHSRPREEVAERVSRTHRHHELFPRALRYRLAFKMPETIPQIDRLRRYYSNMTFLVMLRRPESVIASLMERGWYSDDQMVHLGGDWIFRRTSKSGKKIAPWVSDDMVDEFVRSPEVDRCAMCYIEQYRHLVGRTDCLVVDYDDLVKHPRACFQGVIEALGERFGPLTSKLLGSVRETSRHPAIEVGQIAYKRRQAITEIYESCRGMALAAA
jgi:hypothetical protein